MNLQETIVKDKRLINYHLNRYLKFGPGVPSRLKQAIRYAVLGPGKRLRPIFALEAFKACGGKNFSWIIPVCCGVEMIHNFSLIQDDLPSMDNDDFRRGRLSLHRRFDEGTAILAADALLARAYELFALSPAPMDRKNRVILLISQAIGAEGMAGGQVLDIMPKSEQGKKAELEYFHIARLKTAELIGVSILTGAVIAGVAPAIEKRLYRLGVGLGVLFQITDDILDFKQDQRPRGINRIREEAEILAQNTQKGFSALGGKFWFFSEIATYIVNRKR
ncbi:MAG: polyprenyl synthetase family protein [candidate division WOR-3 bacterium]